MRLQHELADDGVVEAYRRLEEILLGVDLLELSRAVRVRAAESFPVVIGTFDAMHIATALLWAGDTHGEGGNASTVHVFSHNAALSTCARTVGLSVGMG